jgi:AcrR family transcriptional regulator
MKQHLTAKGHSTRERIEKAARQRLIEGGLEALVMRELAESLDIKLGNLQYYFRTRDDLILQVIETEAARDVQTITEHLNRHDAPEEAFKAVAGDLVARWRGQSGFLFQLLGSLAAHSKPFQQLYQRIYLRFYEALESPLMEMNPTLSDEELRLRVRLITALIDGSSMQIKVGTMSAYLDRVQQEALVIANAVSGSSPS